LFLFAAAHKTSEFSNLNFNQAVLLLPINRLSFLHKVKKHLVGPICSGIARNPALGAKIILRTNQKTAELRRKNRGNSAKKSKKTTFAMGYVYTVQSTLVNNVVTVGWVILEGKDLQPPEVNGGFGTELLIALGEFLQFILFFTQ